MFFQLFLGLAYFNAFCTNELTSALYSRRLQRRPCFLFVLHDPVLFHNAGALLPQLVSLMSSPVLDLSNENVMLRTFISVWYRTV